MFLCAGYTAGLTGDGWIRTTSTFVSKFGSFPPLPHVVSLIFLALRELTPLPIVFLGVLHGGLGRWSFGAIGLSGTRLGLGLRGLSAVLFVAFVRIFLGSGNVCWKMIFLE